MWHLAYRGGGDCNVWLHVYENPCFFAERLYSETRCPCVSKDLIESVSVNDGGLDEAQGRLISEAPRWVAPILRRLERWEAAGVDPLAA